MSPVAAPPASRSAATAGGLPVRHARFFTRWTVSLTVLVGALFTSVTALTVTLWFIDPGYTETGPVVDLAFFALGVLLVTVGLASQIRSRRVAGLQQAIVALVALAVAGLLGGRIEPMVGAFVLLVATAPLVVLHPARRRLARPGGPINRPLVIVAGPAVLPAVLYSAGLLEGAWAAGPSCFLGQCAAGDRLAETAALALAVVAVALVAAGRPDGWQLHVWSAAAAATVLALTSLVLPDETGAVAPSWAAATLVWAVALVFIAHRWHPARSRPPHRAERLRHAGRK